MDIEIQKEVIDIPCYARSITMADIESIISSEHYFTADDGAYGASAFRANKGLKIGELVYQSPDPLSLLTFCVLVLKNGFTVTGESACVSPENFNEEKGRQVAREKAVNKIWQLEGYLLKQRLHKSQSDKSE